MLFLPVWWKWLHRKRRKELLAVSYTHLDVYKRQLSMSAAFTVFAKKVGREKRIPFEVSVDPFYSDSSIRYLENIVSDIKDGKAHFAEHDLIEVD